MTIRYSREADLTKIVEIYNASVPCRLATADLRPISVESRLPWYQDHSPHSRPLWVKEINDQIVGWLSLNDFLNGRPAYQATAEVSIYIDPGFHRKGIGRELLTQAIASGPGLGVTSLVALIFSHNEPSISLFEKQGFNCWGHLPEIANMDGLKRDLLIWGRHLLEEGY
ncbi:MULTISPECIES: GNAT family N-acetyltransferase [unclassified Roseofilum]|uniref:GNAT family N-acetyltransferase n=1 Tax=unclassified Roseofilum TaxID=2620099 RepID=UPI001B288673|nr:MULTISPECIES: GNAT family N-acetyltransferase [unclassified Roseofilum]MBP0008507.1 N-acetyltransferase [Roseofilum sp. Belize Diploria]MBP0012695.1 N-acetyltransferase [Roseofilum sp. SID3]MBP0026338.1 N-acetyltransferase [Roseofilum sp. SID2]MBP0032996.1 N-acetyltransferase [Roseofilum sp. Belize BBD 4]MBP0040005.1 N-acetyltransferase [Roseofilum sp. SID1]